MKEILNTWTNKIVFTGSIEQCETYIKGNNVYGLGYSKLRIVQDKIIEKFEKIIMHKLTSQQYKFASELIWGGIPVNRIEAEETPLFKEKAPFILEQYPHLDKSFFYNKIITELIIDGSVIRRNKYNEQK